MDSLKIQVVILSLLAVAPLSASGERKEYAPKYAPEESCMAQMRKYFETDILINYDPKTQKTFVAVPNSSGKFTIYAPNGKTIVDGRNCLSDSKQNSSKFLSEKLQAAADKLSRDKPYAGVIGEIHGNPEAYKRRREELDNVLKSCSEITDPELAKTVNSILKKYFDPATPTTNGSTGSK